MLRKIVLVCALCVLLAVDDADALQRAIAQIKADGFPAESHNVTTVDGYRLTIHRIPHGRGQANSGDRPVVFLMHGLMGASDGFFALGPNYSLAYNLADAGFDVWMGNARGNKYSRSHVTLDPDNNSEKFTFFDFTFDEIGYHDLPTMMDYALEVSGKQKLHYIGHSQGGTVFLILGSLRSDYLSKIASAHLLAGVGYQNYFPNRALAASAANVDMIYTLATMMGVVELFPEFLDGLTPRSGYSIADYCTGDVNQRYMCELIGVRHIVRDDSPSLPGGASLKQAAHYGQNIRDKLFRRYHHGRRNQQIYGQALPPIYNISLITTDVTMHYTIADDLLDERDVLAMAADMPNTKVRKVASDTFSHVDFIVTPDAKALVTDYIIEALKKSSDISQDNSTTTEAVTDNTTIAPPSTIPSVNAPPSTTLPSTTSSSTTTSSTTTTSTTTTSTTTTSTTTPSPTLPPISAADQINADGFPLEIHNVTTIDGYKLVMHRIPHGRGTASSTNRPVVFLMHGLMSSSDAFILLGPEYSLAYNLADAGYDVWMGNARGNKYSRRHMNLDPDHDTEKFDFFDFTFDEIGFRDLPSMMDYALEVTGKQKLHYIGHSQGGTVFLVFGALRSDYMSKIASAHLLAGVGYQNHFPDQALAATAANVDMIYSLALMMGIVELYPEFLDGFSPRSGYNMADFCTGNVNQRNMCELFGMNHLLRDFEYVPGGASLKQAAHYGQNIRDKLFRRYHYGTESNKQVYGIEEPPVYNLSLITADVTMHYTISDNLLDERDVLAMAADMPNTKVRKVARDSFTHGDFVGAIDAKALVTDYIIETLDNTPDVAPDNNSTVIDNQTTTTTTTTTIAPPQDNSAATTMLNMCLILFSLFLIFK